MNHSQDYSGTTKLTISVPAFRTGEPTEGILECGHQLWMLQAQPETPKTQPCLRNQCHPEFIYQTFPWCPLYVSPEAGHTKLRNSVPVVWELDVGRKDV